MTEKIYKYISVGMTVTFLLVGVLFLFATDGVIIFFNQISSFIRVEQVEPGGQHFYAVLSVAYMYVVALLAFLMYRKPSETIFPFLLFNAKFASSVISIFLFIFDRHLLIYIANGVVDGLIGSLVVFMYRSVKGKTASALFRKE